MNSDGIDIKLLLVTHRVMDKPDKKNKLLPPVVQQALGHRIQITNCVPVYICLYDQLLFSTNSALELFNHESWRLEN